MSELLGFKWVDEGEITINFGAVINELFDTKLHFNELLKLKPEGDPNGSKMSDKLAKYFETFDITNGPTFGELRCVFAKHAKCAEAMVLVDVTILRWLVQVIQNNKEGPLILLESPVVQAMCALVIDGDYCTSDVSTVLNEVERYVNSDFNVDFICPSLLTVIKMLSPSSIRTKVEDIVAKIYRKNVDVFGPQCRLFLGDNHDFVKAMEENIPKEQIDRWYDCESSLSWFDQNRKLHSLSGGKLDIRISPKIYIDIFPNCVLTTKTAIVVEGVIEWEDTIMELSDAMRIWDDPDSELLPGQSHLILVCIIKQPALFWEAINKCKELVMLHELIESSIMKQMILTYGVSIVDTTFNHGCTNFKVVCN